MLLYKVKATLYTIVKSIGYGEPTYNTRRPHNALNNWVRRRKYPSRQTINRFSYNTGTRIYVVSGKHATSTASHRKPVQNLITIIICDCKLMKRSFSIVHPQGTHENIAEVSCEKLDRDSGEHM